MDVAGKTGTSDGIYDAWSIGYSSEVTVAVWVDIMTGLGLESDFGSLADFPADSESVQPRKPRGSLTMSGLD